MVNGKPNVSVSNLSLDLTQPLLRGGGWAVNLEPLTQSEWNLVYAIRNYARFRKINYVAIASGQDLTNTLASSVSASLGFGSFTPQAGYLPAVLRAGSLEIDRRNVASLKDILRRFEAFVEGGDISQLQVDQVKQQLLRGESSVLQDELAYQNSLDNFKIQLGMSPSLDLQVDVSPLRPLIQGRVREILLIGAASDRIERELKDVANTVRAGDLETAVHQAFRNAVAGETVLLAPACASFDQFENFEHRGRVFKQLVGQLEET